MWSDSQWRSFCLLVEQGWPGEFGAATRAAWRTLLDGYEPATCIQALRSLIAKGGTFRPSVSELVGEIAADATAPTFEEAVQMLYGPGGIMFARPAVTRWASEHERRALADSAIAQRAMQTHPLLAAFVESVGVEHLRALSLDDPDWGAAARRGLAREWEAFTERAHQRQAAALAQGRPPRDGLRAFSPLAALGMGAKQITEGEQA
jgi:hypothetical protein